MSFYESVIIARQEISVQQVETLADDFTKVIEENGGKITKRENWGLRSLAYKIKKNRKGHYAFLRSDAPDVAVKEMERLMGLHDDIMRVMTIKVDVHEEGPSAVIQAKNSRDERPRRPRRD